MSGPALLRIGTAGWSVPRAVAENFPETGSGLERYAAVFNAAEINTTFYRSHKPGTYTRWAASVPDGFKFSVKMPRAITHERRLVDVADSVATFLGDCRLLGDRLGPVLVQLPPSLAFDLAVASAFLAMLREHTDAPVALEPRHASWFEPDAEATLVTFKVARVAADPAKVEAAGRSGGWPGLVYHRLHGSPRMYYSAYDEAALKDRATSLRASVVAGAETWCVFDNTASGAAAADALRLAELLRIED